MADWWERINRGANLWTIFQALRGPEWVVVVVGGTEFFVAQGNIPGWAVIPAAIFTMAGVLWLFNLMEERRERRSRQSADYSLWDGIDEFTTWDAACLWDGKPLNSGALTERGLKVMRDMKKAIDDGKIVGSPLNKDGQAFRGTRVTREQLQAFAGMYGGDRPKFLYKDAR